MRKPLVLTKSNKVKDDLADTLVQVVIVILVTLFCLTILLPFINIFALAFNDGRDAARGGVFLWPRIPTLDNFKAVFKDGKIVSAYKITVSRTFLGTLLSLWLMTMSAYVLHIKTLPGRNFFSMAIALTMLFGGGLIPTYIQYNRLGLINTFWIYIFPGAIGAYYLFMIRTFYDGVPDSLIESAKLDGCGWVRIYTQIILPLSKPIIAVIGLYCAVNHWNDWFSGAFYQRSNKLWPVQTVLQSMLNKAMKSSEEISSVGQLIAAEANTTTTDSLKMAAVIVTITPILMVYPFIQKYFAKGVMIGAVKG
ncbi:MAG: carbohydrate ABC transporter permease [Clostridiales bacterium]|nr:carbohydrate ABC transporter permease [Clostridiales bacterium]